MSFTRLISRKLIEIATEYVTETIPAFIATAINGKLNKGLVEDTDTTTTSGLTNPTIQFLLQKYTATASFVGAMRFTSIRKYEFNSEESNGTGGVHGAGLDWYEHNGSGNPNMAMAHKAKVDILNETIVSNVVISESDVSVVEGAAVDNLYGHRSRLVLADGMISYYYGYRPSIEAGTGTVTYFTGFEFPDLSAFTNTKRTAFHNKDAFASIVSAGPIVDSSTDYYSPTNSGFTYTIPDNKTWLMLSPTIDINDGCTINLPNKDNIPNGQVIEITTARVIYGITWGGRGATVLGAPTSMAAYQTVRFKHFKGENFPFWYYISGDAIISYIEQNSRSAAYTLVRSGAGKHIFHPRADTGARTFTIPANSSVPYPIGTVLTFVNQNGTNGIVTIAITSDTMRLAGVGTTGSRTLARNGIATAMKITATEWIINGTGLT